MRMCVDMHRGYVNVSRVLDTYYSDMSKHSIVSVLGQKSTLYVFHS